MDPKEVIVFAGDTEDKAYTGDFAMTYLTFVLLWYPMRLLFAIVYHFTLIWGVGGEESVEEIAEVISKAIGPSGPNSRYVLNLAEGLRRIGLGTENDEHLFSLEEAIKKMDSGKYHQLHIY